jgi:hypothetical protein
VWRVTAPHETPGARVHHLKTWPEPFAAVRRRDKPYEIRVNDRDYAVGDLLHLQECVPPVGYTGEDIWVQVTYMTRGGEWGLPDSLCVMGLRWCAT